MELKKLWADFNEVDGETVWTSLRRVQFVPEGEPQIGQWIELYDHEGNTCWGVVTDVDDPIVRLRLDLSTWTDANAIQIMPRFGSPVEATAQGREERTGGVERIAV